MVYRPTVRMDDIYKDYIEQIYQATPNNIDRNVIIRLMLFCAPHGALFRSRVETLLKSGQVFPVPLWEVGDGQLWKLSEWFGELPNAGEVERHGESGSMVISSGTRIRLG